MKLVFATNNEHKLKEVQKLLGNKIELLSLTDINCKEEIPEDFMTLEENALQKAEYVYKKYGVNCFADDTGLEVDALNGEPGVLSARYAGNEKDSQANMNKVLIKLAGVKNRKAKFRTVISLILDDEEYCFEGEVIGEIMEERSGTDGFGYDPIFKAEGFVKTFAEMSLDEKNQISHRARATQKLVDFLLNY